MVEDGQYRMKVVANWQQKQENKYILAKSTREQLHYKLNRVYRFNFIFTPRYYAEPNVQFVCFILLFGPYALANREYQLHHSSEWLTEGNGYLWFAGFISGFSNLLSPVSMSKEIPLILN